MYVSEQNPDLKPERMMNYEISVGQGLFEGRLTAELTAYIANGSNLIQTVPLEPAGSKNMNVGDFNNRGFELELRWNILKNFDLKGNYSYLNMKKPVLYAPGQQAYIAVNYRLKQWSMNVNYQYIHELFLKLEDATPAVTSNYGLLNAKVSYRQLKFLDIFVKGENLTDKSYSIVYDYPMPGITVFGGINLRIMK
jgi:iron complex outermembrane receptor protein